MDLVISRGGRPGRPNRGHAVVRRRDRLHHVHFGCGRPRCHAGAKAFEFNFTYLGTQLDLIGARDATGCDFVVS